LSEWSYGGCEAGAHFDVFHLFHEGDLFSPVVFIGLGYPISSGQIRSTSARLGPARRRACGRRPLHFGPASKLLGEPPNGASYFREKRRPNRLRPGYAASTARPSPPAEAMPAAKPDAFPRKPGGWRTDLWWDLGTAAVPRGADVRVMISRTYQVRNSISGFPYVRWLIAFLSA